MIVGVVRLFRHRRVENMVEERPIAISGTTSFGFLSRNDLGIQIPFLLVGSVLEPGHGPVIVVAAVQGAPTVNESKVTIPMVVRSELGHGAPMIEGLTVHVAVGLGVEEVPCRINDVVADRRPKVTPRSGEAADC